MQEVPRLRDCARPRRWHIRPGLAWPRSAVQGCARPQLRPGRPDADSGGREVTETTHTTLIEALIAAQSEFPGIPKEAMGQARGGKYPYATLPAVLEAV